MSNEGMISALFSPQGGCRNVIVAAIDAAQVSIKIATYDFSSIVIASALCRAIARGVSVVVVLDQMQHGGEQAVIDALTNAGATVLFDHAHAAMHNKYCVIDAATVLTGSYNWTQRAEVSNAENLLVIERCPNIVRAYLADHLRHVNHSNATYKRKPTLNPLP